MNNTAKEIFTDFSTEVQGFLRSIQVTVYLGFT